MNKRLTTDEKIEQLAIMVKNGFDELRSEVKNEIKEFRGEMNARFDSLEKTVNGREPHHKP